MLKIAKMVADAQDALSIHPLESNYPPEDVLEGQGISLKLTLWSNKIQVKTFISRFAGCLTSQLSYNGNQYEIS